MIIAPSSSSRTSDSSTVSRGTSANDLSPAGTQGIPWRRRADLVITERTANGNRIFVVKDPLRLSYFELTEESHYLLTLLDGQITFKQLVQAFQTRFPHRGVSPDQLKLSLDQFAAQMLTSFTGIGLGQSTASRISREMSRQRWGRWANPLAIRFRGVDPDRWLEGLDTWFGWVFSPVCVVLEAILILASALLLLIQFDSLVDRFPEAHRLLSGRNLIWFPVLLCGVKILHELGHGLACKRFGGECREMGLLLLLLTPTLYCNVSDAWMLRSKWQRMAVSAAGVWVELLIAATATLLWWWSQPGLFHTLCLNLMVICGLSTLIFNGNPLLKYDGYFILADWLEIPNLQEQSTTAVRKSLASWFCGVSSDADGTLSRRIGLWFYGIASWTYRMALVGMMVWGLYRWSKPHGLGVIAIALSIPLLMAVIGGILSPMMRGVRDPAQRRRVRWPQFWWRGLLSLACLTSGVITPLPMSVVVDARLDDGPTQSVYVTTSGTLVESVSPGSAVVAGQVICSLEEPGLTRQLAHLDGEVNLARIRLETLERQRISDSVNSESIPALQAALADLQAQREQLQSQVERLTLRAPCDGIVIPVLRPREAASSASLKEWSGSPLDERNLGSYLTEGTTVYLVGDWPSLQADLLVPQADATLIRIGQKVQIRWNEWAGEYSAGQIVELGSLDGSSHRRDRRKHFRGWTESDRGDAVRPDDTWIRVRVTLEATPARLPRNATGRAKIEVQPLAIASRLTRWARQTFAIRSAQASKSK